MDESLVDPMDFLLQFTPNVPLVVFLHSDSVNAFELSEEGGHIDGPGAVFFFRALVQVLLQRLWDEVAALRIHVPQQLGLLRIMRGNVLFCVPVPYRRGAPSPLPWVILGHTILGAAEIN